MKIKMFNKLPYFIYINGKKYFINTDFRNMISFEVELMGMTKDKNIEDFVYKSLKKFCPYFFKEKHTEEEIVELNKQFLWFYKCGRENYHSSSGGGVSLDEVFSYEYDDEYIFGAFLEQYNVDLTSVKDLHWWKFKAMLKSLKKDTKIEEIKSYRGYTGKDKDMRALRDYWKLPIKTELQKQLDETAEMLMKYNQKK